MASFPHQVHMYSLFTQMTCGLHGNVTETSSIFILHHTLTERVTWELNDRVPAPEP